MTDAQVATSEALEIAEDVQDTAELEVEEPGGEDGTSKHRLEKMTITQNAQLRDVS